MIFVWHLSVEISVLTVDTFIIALNEKLSINKPIINIIYSSFTRFSHKGNPNIAHSPVDSKKKSTCESQVVKDVVVLRRHIALVREDKTQHSQTLTGE